MDACARTPGRLGAHLRSSVLVAAALSSLRCRRRRAEDAEARHSHGSEAGRQDQGDLKKHGDRAFSTLRGTVPKILLQTFEDALNMRKHAGKANFDRQMYSAWLLRLRYLSLLP